MLTSNTMIQLGRELPIWFYIFVPLIKYCRTHPADLNVIIMANRAKIAVV
jgi:hypothetical protein